MKGGIIMVEMKVNENELGKARDQLVQHFNASLGEKEKMKGIIDGLSSIWEGPDHDKVTGMLHDSISVIESEYIKIHRILDHLENLCRSYKALSKLSNSDILGDAPQDEVQGELEDPFDSSDQEYVENSEPVVQQTVAQEAHRTKINIGL